MELHQLFANPLALLRVPVFLVALLLVRGMPAALYLRAIGVKASSAVALLQATSLPVIVTAAQIGLALGVLLSVNAAALICAGVLSTLIFPTGALEILRRQDS